MRATFRKTSEFGSAESKSSVIFLERQSLPRIETTAFDPKVIKIASPLRQFPSSLAGESSVFLGNNRGKRALALDLKQPGGQAVLHRMVATADVLAENFRPSVPAAAQGD